ncbi:hypothetical protein GE061_009105 [Apolygus lucorum]|uniref:FP protein C-terminal domain-containing protein n=1 Tax=Apolygus lucorum TaxID=248454 RepID=A0A6A4K7S5_APOLU|nr:hypothetical protein GE061_015076 [Apolygus lucorum]KAF6214365.1 hypothetical protein GE061_009105 [Apolygus lucorum]
MNRDAKSKWECDRCKNFDGEDGNADEDSSSSEEDEGVQVSGDLKTLIKTVNEINMKVSKISAIEEQLVEMNTSMEFMNEKYETFIVEIKTLTEKVSLLEAQNIAQKNVISDLQIKVDRLEQDSRKTNIEIYGVPESVGENCYEVVKSVSGIAGKEVNPKSAFRLGPKVQGKARMILADLGSEADREMITKSAKGCSALRASALSSAWPDSRIYVNENLTSYRKGLLRNAKEIAKSKGAKFVWSRDFKIFVRMEENAKVIVINNETDLLKIK